MEAQVYLVIHVDIQLYIYLLKKDCNLISSYLGTFVKNPLRQNKEIQWTWFGYLGVYCLCVYGRYVLVVAHLDMCMYDAEASRQPQIMDWRNSTVTVPGTGTVSTPEHIWPTACFVFMTYGDQTQIFTPVWQAHYGLSICLGCLQPLFGF